jgi:hypothetical protein
MAEGRILKYKGNEMITSGLAQTFSGLQTGWATKPDNTPELETKKACPARERGPGAQKKECLFLTNKATMFLKTKDRVYEQSQTKPILVRRLGDWVIRGLTGVEQTTADGQRVVALNAATANFPTTLLRVQLTPPESSGYLALGCRWPWVDRSQLAVR